MNLKLVLIASVGLSLSAAAGCVGTPNDTLPIGAGGSGGGPAATTAQTSTGSGNTDSPARKYFVMNVFPALSAGAQPCTACHTTGMEGAPVYLDPDPETAYTKTEAFPGLITLPENSLLLLHGLHTGPAMTQAQHDVTTTWLTMEAQERGLGSPATSSSSSAASSSSSGGPSKPADLTSALAAFANCMDPTEWLNDGLDQIAKVQTNNNQGQCNACHLTGDYGNYLNANDANLTFQQQKVFPFIKRWVSGTYDMNGNFTGLKAVPREYLKAEEAKLCNPAKQSCHPTYTMSDTLKAGIDTFIANTLNKMENNLCP